MLTDFLTTIKSKLNCGYVLGSQGEVMTADRLASLVKTNGRSHYYFSGYSAEHWIGKECFDCSGLIVWTLQNMGLIKYDYCAHDIFGQLCTEISRTNLQPGDLCFVQGSSRITHVGVYVGGGKVIHARGTKYGVVETPVLAYFNKFGRLKYFKGEIEERIAAFQKLYGLTVDGIIGPQTLGKAAEVKKFVDELLIKKG